MDTRESRQVQSLFEAVVTLHPDQREPQLMQLCNDAEVRAQVIDLLQSHDHNSRFLETPAWTQHDIADGQSRVGQNIGAYHITAQLGSGGMGVVYLGERNDAAFEKQVAIKVMPLGGAAAMQRFNREVHILAALSHPNLARLLDAGQTTDGLPYMVMEYIEGEAIDGWCLSRPLNDVLAVFIKVCEALDSAHRHLVIHRDIKAGNILVKSNNEPVVLDFGIAKLLAADEEQTQTGLQPFTPHSASPEQLRGDALTTSTDVYSLGLLMLRACTGVSFNPSNGPGAAVQRIRPSRLVLQGQSRLPDGQIKRRARRLRGDLDHILLKATHPEVNRRYASMRELAEDIQRHLHDEPVRARPDSMAYRLFKRLQRHPFIATATLLVLGVLSWQQWHVLQEKARVEAERNKLEYTKGFLLDLFSISDPGEARGNAVTAREMLDAAHAKINQQSDFDAATKVELLQVMAQVYGRLGLFKAALPLMQQANDLVQESQPENTALLAELTSDMGILMQLVGDIEGAEKRHREALNLRLKAHPQAPKDVALSHNQLGEVLMSQGRHTEAESEFDAALRLYGELDPLSEELALIHHNLGVLNYHMSRYPAAEKHYLATLNIREQTLGDPHPWLARSINNLAVLYDVMGAYDRAEPMYRRSVDMRLRLFGEKHPDYANGLNNYASFFEDTGEFEKGLSLYKQVIEIYREILGDKHAKIANVLNHIGHAHLQMDSLDAAETALLQSIDMYRALNASGHYDNPLLYPRHNLAMVRQLQGHTAEALQIIDAVIEDGRELLGPEHVALGNALVSRAQIHRQLDHREAALADLHAAETIYREKLDADHWRLHWLSALRTVLTEPPANWPDHPELQSAAKILRARKGENSRMARSLKQWMTQSSQPI